MKRTLIALTAAGLMVGLPALADTGVSASASVSATTSMRGALEQKREAFKEAQDKFKAAVQGDRQDIKQAVGERNDEMQAARVEFRSSVAEKTLTHTVAILNAMANRLQRLIDRIDSRIAKEAAAGGNVTASQVASAKAKTDLASAQAQIVTLSQVDLSVASGTSTTTIKANLDIAKADAKNVRIAFQTVKQDLIDALKALPRVSVSGEATTTATTSAEVR